MNRQTDRQKREWMDDWTDDRYRDGRTQFVVAIDECVNQ